MVQLLSIVDVSPALLSVMHHELSLVGPAFELRPATLEHARFIFELRRDPALNAFINETPDDYERHLGWMHAYLERPDDYYFVVAERRTHALEGTCALYNLDAALGRAEWGRWLISPDSLAAVESAFLLYSLAFERLGLTEVYCRTMTDNLRVLSFHKACGLRVKSVAQNGGSRTGSAGPFVEHSLTQREWPTLKHVLLRKCELVAGILHG